MFRPMGVKEIRKLRPLSLGSDDRTPGAKAAMNRPPVPA
jgi:hypothetical protein